eukprot:TRINITY_DN5879_c0_g1_i4.p1 TRINITY_DN5879_c0_g1~~TRINITY_DN5879_c0_g1_i4.p1  ORF type:complete len:477 (-),score=106.76 TRINITY_DN5879_c0_g1_i4:1662-3092(-)
MNLSRRWSQRKTMELDMHDHKEIKPEEIFLILSGIIESAEEVRASFVKLETAGTKGPRNSLNEFEEYITTATIIIETMRALLNMPQVVGSKESLLRVGNLLVEIKKEIGKMGNDSAFLRSFSSLILRSPLEKKNNALQAEGKYFLQLLQKNCSDRAAIQQTQLTQADVKIDNDEGQAFWENHLGIENPLVEWELFVSELGNFLNRKLSVEEQELLRFILDYTRTGFVSRFRFAEFLKGFAPLSSSIENLKILISQSWFYGYLSGEEAKKLLENQPSGTFLVRFSKSCGGSFVLCFVMEEGKIFSVLVESCMPECVKVSERADNNSIVVLKFPTLYDMLNHYGDYLEQPMETSFFKSDWFHGDITNEEAENLLSNTSDQKEGTFLIHLNKTGNGFVCSYLHGKKVLHSDINSISSCLFDAANFASICAFIKQNRGVLKYNFDVEGIPNLKIVPWPSDFQSTPVIIYLWTIERHETGG